MNRAAIYVPQAEDVIGETLEVRFVGQTGETLTGMERRSLLVVLKKFIGKEGLHPLWLQVKARTMRHQSVSFR